MYGTGIQAQAKYGQTPQISIIEKRDHILRFILKDCDVSVANALRRVMISEIPTLAIDIVSINANTTTMQDEMIAHRLGFVPVNSYSIHKFNYKIACGCSDTCPNCTARYTVDVTAPSDSSYTITHLDIQEVGASPPISIFMDDDYVAATAEMPQSARGLIIAKIPRGSTFSAELQAIKGIGKAHAKWSPVATATYRNISQLYISQQMQRQVPNSIKVKILEVAFPGVFKLVDSASGREINPNIDVSTGHDWNLVVSNTLLFQDNHDIKEILAEAGFEKYITHRYAHQEYLFTVEAVGQLTAIDILKHACDVLINKVKAINADFCAQPTTVSVLGNMSTAALDLE